MSDTPIPASPSAADYANEADRPLVPTVDEPIELLKTWLAEARETEINDGNAMALATVDADGMPDVRMVLLKGIDTGGLQFFTNFDSEKGKQLGISPKAALCFHWKSQRRQVRVRGLVERLPDDAADAYFNSRAPQSRISAIASDQSRPLEDRAVFEQRIAELSSIYGDDGDIPRPDYWGGFRIIPLEIEFWQDQAFRMHDRLRFKRDSADAAWTSGRLYP